MNDFAKKWGHHFEMHGVHGKMIFMHNESLIGKKLV